MSAFLTFYICFLNYETCIKYVRPKFENYPLNFKTETFQTPLTRQKFNKWAIIRVQIKILSYRT